MDGIRDHLSEPSDLSVVHWLKVVMGFGNEVANDRRSSPTARDFGDGLNEGIVGEPEQYAAKSYSEVTELFQGKRPTDFPAQIFQALRTRWGVRDGKIHTLKATTEAHRCEIEDLIEGERGLFRRLGFTIRTDAKTQKAWLKL